MLASEHTTKGRCAAAMGTATNTVAGDSAPRGTIMIQRHLLKHLFPIGASCAVVLSWTIRGGSEPAAPSDHVACLNAYKSAQELGHNGHFRQAKEVVDTCVREACGYILF